MQHTATLVLDEEVQTEVGLLRVLDGPDKGRQHRLDADRVRVGSGSGVELTLQDPTVSRVHCELVREREALRLRDLGSKNGCWLDRARVEEALLFPGTCVQVGSTTLSIDMTSARVVRPAWKGEGRFGELVGDSAPMRKLFAQMAKLAAGDVSIRIHGETGTGKELVARAIHDVSDRCRGPFVCVDGAALTEHLATDELFGHVRGAFTGAESARAGAFERAHGGTIFIDEVGDLPLDVQPIFLRAVEDRTIQRIGADHRISFDARIICATHRSLERLHNQGAFREDLLYRLGDVVLEVPPLRERGLDVLRIAREIANAHSSSPEAIAVVEQALEERRGYQWPGNVRELRSFVRRVLQLGMDDKGAPIGAEAALPRIRTDLSLQQARDAWVRAFERQYLATLLDETGGRVEVAATRAGISRSMMYKLMRKMGLRSR